MVVMLFNPSLKSSIRDDKELHVVQGIVIITAFDLHVHNVATLFLVLNN